MIPLLIARNTYREAVRDRILLGMTVAGVVAMLAIQLLSPLALGEGDRITIDLGLSTISLLGLLSILLVTNLFGAILLIPAFTTLFRPAFVQVESAAAGS